MSEEDPFLKDLQVYIERRREIKMLKGNMFLKGNVGKGIILSSKYIWACVAE